jgi:hypothetical protein
MKKNILTTHLHFNLFNINTFSFFKKGLIDEKINILIIYFNILVLLINM